MDILRPSALVFVLALYGCPNISSLDGGTDAGAPDSVVDAAVALDATADAGHAADTANGDAAYAAAPDLVHVAYIGVAGNNAPFVVLMPRDGRQRCSTEHLSPVCTMVRCTAYPQAVGTQFDGVLRMTSGAHHITNDYGGAGTSRDFEGVPFTMTGEAVQIETMGRGESPLITASASLFLPAPITLLGPLPEERSTLDISQDLAIRWRPPPNPAGVSVHAGFFASDGIEQRELFCDFPAADGAATVPAALLQRFGPGSGDFVLSSYTGAVFERDGWYARFSVFDGARLEGSRTNYFVHLRYE